MTHIITNLKCDISYNPSARYLSLAGGRNAKIFGYGGRVEKVFGGKLALSLVKRTLFGSL